jgi:hypothetical protein
VIAYAADNLTHAHCRLIRNSILAIRSRRSASDQKINARTELRPAIPAETALSFLKDTKGMLTWSLRDLTDTLKINRREAKEVIALLAAQGYVKSANERDEGMTTSAGESVSRAKPADYFCAESAVVISPCMWLER